MQSFMLRNTTATNITATPQQAEAASDAYSCKKSNHQMIKV